MSHPVYRDAIEDLEKETVDLGAINEYLDSRFKEEVAVSTEDAAANEMIAEIIELSIAEEVDRFPWREPNLPSSGLENRYSISKILDLDYLDGNPSIMARMAREASRVIQFPENTAYLHGLGCFSSGSVVNFQVEYNHKFIPTGLYTLCAQPSGSGKSSAHGYFIDPIHEALDRRNHLLFMLHKNIDGEIDALHKLADKAKTDQQMLKTYAQAMQSLNDEKMRSPIVYAAKKNATPQSAEEQAVKQGGVFSVCSDEQEAIDTYLGLSYTDGKTSPDNGVFIAAFGGDLMGTARISRAGITIPVRGAFAVVAQNSGVDTIIRAGAAGRGVSERCLILKEPNMIGYRTYTREDGFFDRELSAEYAALCENMVQGECNRRLTFSEQCRDMIVDLKNLVEPQCRPGAKYGDTQIKGFASKIQQHVIKMAANFHIAEQWNPKITKSPSFEIQEPHLLKAMRICMDLLDSYKVLIESESDMSASKLVVFIIGVMKGYALKGTKNFNLDKLRLSVTKESWYGAIEGKKIDFLLNLLTRCEEMNFCHIKETGKDKKHWQVLINPALKTFTISLGDN